MTQTNPKNRDLSYKICMAIRFGNEPGGVGTRPTAGALAKKLKAEKEEW